MPLMTLNLMTVVTSAAAALSAPTSFTDLGLRPHLAAAATEQRWVTPTPIQRAAIPAILRGDNVWAEAPTGSGKTASFAMPLLDRLCEAIPPRRRGRDVRVLVLTPTRELAVQTAKAFGACAETLPSRVKVVALHGGVSINPQLRSLAGGADVVVATPGRLLDVLESNGVSLGAVSALLLDEADRLLAPGFEVELDALLARLPPAQRRQTLLFSATFPYRARPKAARLFEGLPYTRLGEGGTEDGSEEDGSEEGAAHEGAAHEGAARRPGRRPAASASERYASTPPPSTIAQRAIVVDVRERTPLLRHLLAAEGWARAMVFVGSQRSAEHVAAKLRKSGVDAAPLHGALTQEVREGRLEDLRASALRVLVATDVAARGLDVAGLEAIVNYELPRSTADYTHRVGRTGRAGEDGVAVSFVATTGAGNEAHFALIERRHGGMRVPREVIDGFEPKDVDRMHVAPEELADAAAAVAGGAPPCVAERGAASLVPGVVHSRLGLAHDRMHGGVKGRRMSKKDKLRAAAASAARRP